MTEAVEQIAIRKSPLEELHARAGAAMEEHHGWTMPATYGDVRAEYVAVREGGAGVVDLSSRGRIRVSGSEAVLFLNGLITNDMKTLAENRWMPAAFPNVQGRLIASVRVVRVSDGFLIDTEAVTHERVLKTIERFTLAGDFHVTDLTSETVQLSLQGRKASLTATSVFGEAVVAMPRDGAVQASWQQSDVTIVRATHTGENGFDLILKPEPALQLWEALIKIGSRPVGNEALNTLRIEAGLPVYGADMDETNVVSEAALDDAVSFTKGCYIGQEIIARIKYRGHVAKKLTGLLLEHGAQVDVGANVVSADGKQIGRLTSVTYSPALGETIALGYLKYDYLAPGTGVKVITNDKEFSAQVKELPFVRGSWWE